MVTVDEKAEGSTVTIDNLASIRELNLDRATQVTGDGSISHLNVNAPGSTVSMLPDTIYIRPGITANVHGQNMDNKTANEASEDPRILAGYPKARNIAPTSANAVFRTNKAGTIRWALTALMDGSVGEEDLIKPPVLWQYCRQQRFAEGGEGQRGDDGQDWRSDAQWLLLPFCRVGGRS